MRNVLFSVTGNVDRRVATDAAGVARVARGTDAAAAEIGPGERTGTYRTTGDAFLADASGRSFISFEDYAVALVDERERPQYLGRRFGVAY